MVRRMGVLLGAMAAVVLAGATVYAVALATGHHSPAGPSTGSSLQPYPRVGASSHEIGGGNLTLGLQVLTLVHGSARVVVTGVTLVDARGLTIVVRRIAGPSRPVYQFLSVPSLPPTKYNPVSVPAIGTTISQAKRGWQLLLGIHVAPNTLAKMDGIRVEYRSVGSSNVEQQTFPVTFVVCTEESQLVHDRCPPPDIPRSH